MHKIALVQTGAHFAYQEKVSFRVYAALYIQQTEKIYNTIVAYISCHLDFGGYLSHCQSFHISLLSYHLIKLKCYIGFAWIVKVYCHNGDLQRMEERL